MRKERFTAFFDAIMAIIMTIAVLEFAQPDGTEWSDLSHLGFQIVVYAISFFWLGMMWISIHNIWDGVEYITKGIMYVNLTMLFFSSMIPFLVIYVGQNINEQIPQFLYGLDVLCITVCNLISIKMLQKANPNFLSQSNVLFRINIFDISAKALGVILCLTVYPPAAMISVFIALFMLGLNIAIIKKKSPQNNNSKQ